MSDPSVLDQRSRPELIEEARGHGVDRPERMTRAELKDEILRRTKTGDEQVEARGLFGVARAMLASVVETGLNLPDAAALIRGSTSFDARVTGPGPVATVTLAEIYAAQGHKKRALGMLDEVLGQEPDHEVAQRLRRELAEPLAPVAPVTLVETNGIEVQTGKPPEVEIAPATAESVLMPEAVFDAEPAFEPEAVFDAAPAFEPGSAEAEPSFDAETVPAVTKLDEPRLVFQQKAGGVDFYWELSAAWLRRAGLEGGSGHAAVQIVGFLPRGASPQKQERTLRLPGDGESHGALHLDDLGAPAVVRAALGWATPGEFLPLVVAKSLEELSERAVEGLVWQRLGAIFG